MTSRPVRIWLCADDYGISQSVSDAIRDLIARGRINATSVIVVAPSFGNSQANALTALNVDTRRAAIGLHVTLTAPFKPLSVGFEPTSGGAFLSLAQTLALALLRRLNPDKYEMEIAAQVDSFISAFGRPPDFIDGHQHVQLFPQICDAVLNVVNAKAPNAWVRQCGRITPLANRLADRKGLLLDFLSRRFRMRAQHLGVRTNPAFAGTYNFLPDADFSALFPRFLEGLSENSVIMCHPGRVDEELRRLDPVTTLREREYAYFGSDAFPAVLASRGVALA